MAWRPLHGPVADRVGQVQERELHEEEEALQREDELVPNAVHRRWSNTGGQPMGLSWSAMRKVLEHENICDSLKGRVQYFVTRYRESHDEEGRVAVRLDGNEIEPIGIKIGVAAAEIVVGVEADEERNGLHQENGAGHDGRSPIDIVHGVLEKEVKKSRTLCLHK